MSFLVLDCNAGGELTLKKRIVVFSPHPDDEIIGCGGTIAKKISEGHEVFIIIMTDGRYSFFDALGIDSNPSPVELKIIRNDEARNSSNMIGVPSQNILFLDYVDGTLKLNMKIAEERVIEILDNIWPIEIYLPYKHDGHPDHQATYNIIRNATEKMGISPAMYQYSIVRKYGRIGPVIDRIINYFTRSIICVDISDYFNIKLEAIKKIKSQLTLIYPDNENNLTNMKISVLSKEPLYINLENKESFYIR